MLWMTLQPSGHRDFLHLLPRQDNNVCFKAYTYLEKLLMCTTLIWTKTDSPCPLSHSMGDPLNTANLLSSPLGNSEQYWIITRDPNLESGPLLCRQSLRWLLRNADEVAQDCFQEPQTFFAHKDSVLTSANSAENVPGEAWSGAILGVLLRGHLRKRNS